MTPLTSRPLIPFLPVDLINRRFERQLVDAFREVLSRGTFVLGASVSTFEAEFANYCGVRGCVTVGNGLEALELTLRAWINQGRLTRGAAVVVPANSFIASAFAVTRAGLQVVLCDVDPTTQNLSLEGIARACTRETRALISVHLHGRLAITPDIVQYCRDRSILILEDAAQAHGARGEGRMAGALADAGAFSFYPTKNLGALGDAGCVTSDDLDLIAEIRSLRNYGSAERYYHVMIGTNSRTDELQAACLSIKLPSLDTDNARRRALAARYCREIVHPNVLLPPLPSEPLSHVWHNFVIRSKKRQSLRNHITANQIGTGIHYPRAIHNQTAYLSLRHADLTYCDQLQDEVLSLPINPIITDDEVTCIIRVINEWPGDA